MDEQDAGAVARQIIDSNSYMTLGTADERGLPWVSPVWYAPAEYREFFWVSSPDARHSRNLAARPQLSIVIFDSRAPEASGQAVYMSATAHEARGAELERGIAVLSAHSKARAGQAWSPADVQEPARHRLYRAIASEHFVLGARDERLLVSVEPANPPPKRDQTATPRGTPMPRSALAAGAAATRLPAQDLERARRFYAEKLGLEPIEARPGGLRYRCGAGEFALFESAGAPSGEHTQMGWEVADIEQTVRELRDRGLSFEEYDVPGLRTVGGIAEVQGNYPSKGGVGERAAWFRDSEGNLLGIGQRIAPGPS